MDVHVNAAISTGLKRRGIIVLTAQEDGSRRFADAQLLDRATALQRVLFSQDEDLLAITPNFRCVLHRPDLWPSTGRDDW
jgi:hypothetical protein